MTVWVPPPQKNKYRQRSTVDQASSLPGSESLSVWHTFKCEGPGSLREGRAGAGRNLTRNGLGHRGTSRCTRASRDVNITQSVMIIMIIIILILIWTVTVMMTRLGESHGNRHGGRDLMIVAGGGCEVAALHSAYYLWYRRRDRTEKGKILVFVQRPCFCEYTRFVRGAAAGTAQYRACDVPFQLTLIVETFTTLHTPRVRRGPCSFCFGTTTRDSCYQN